MPEVKIQLRGRLNAGLRLFLDRWYLREVEQVQVFTGGATLYNLTKFAGTRLYKVFEVTGGELQERTFKRTADRIRLNPAPTGKLVCIPKGFADLIQLKLGRGSAVELFVKQHKLFQYRDITIDSLDLTDDSQGVLEFATSATGPWSSSLTASLPPASFFVRVNPTKFESVFDYAITVSAKTFL